MRSRSFLVLLVLGLGCSSEESAEREPDAPPQGADEGDPCGATADCLAGLRCRGQVCVDETSGGAGAGVGEGEGAGRRPVHPSGHDTAKVWES